MRQLRYLRPGDDGNHVVLETADGAEQFVLYVTVPLRDAIRVDLPKLHTAPTAAPSDEGISPREIQIRVRAGADPEVLAEAHGMSLERVLRFAGPVIDERIRVADTARRGRARRSTTEGQTVVFGEAVDARFAAHGIDPFTVRWDAYRRIDGQWVVNAAWTLDDAEHCAEWNFNLTARNVTPADDTAADLLSDRPIRPTAVVVAEPEPEPDQSDAPPLAPGVVAFPRLASAPDPDPEPQIEIPVDEVFDQAALDEIDPDPRHVGDEPQLEPVSGDDFGATPLPLRLAESADESTKSSDNGASTKPLPRLRNLGVAEKPDDAAPARPKSNQRPKVPAWDDIMLGVRRQTD